MTRLIKTTVDLHRKQGTLKEAPLPARGIPESQDTPCAIPVKSRSTPHLRIWSLPIHITTAWYWQASMARSLLSLAAGKLAWWMALLPPPPFASHRVSSYKAMTFMSRIPAITRCGAWTSKQKRVETVLGSGQQARTLNVPGYGRAVSLNSPWALYRHGRCSYIAMAGSHQIWYADLTSGYAEPFAGTGQEGWIDDILSDAAFGQPSGLAGDGRRLYVADTEVNALRVLSLDPDGETATVAGGGLFTFGDQDGFGQT